MEAHRDQLQALQSTLDNNSLRFASARTMDSLAHCLSTFQSDALPLLAAKIEIDRDAGWSKSGHAQSPEQSESLLRLRGTQVGSRFAQAVRFQPSTLELHAWMRMIVEAGNVNSVSTLALLRKSKADGSQKHVSTRLAAVVSVKNFLTTILDAESDMIYSSDVLNVHITIYDMLVDDEEDVRNEAARIVSLLLSRSDARDVGRAKHQSLSPPAAKVRLLHLLCHRSQASSVLWIQATLRLTGLIFALNDTVRARVQASTTVTDVIAHIGSTKLPSVEQSFATAIPIYDVVFEEEKQNLYIDCVEEAEAWAELTCKLDPAAWQPDIAEELKKWTEEGLYFFHAKFEEITDGPLGLFSNPGIYTVLARVLLAAKVLLSNDAKMGRQNEDLYQLLEGLYKKGEEIGLHRLLLRKMDAILAR